MTRPNILWYCTDQQRFDTIGALGNPYVRTSAIDSLVRGGAAFTHAYCQSPICTPSRSSYMTGLYPSRVHNTRNGNDSFPVWPPLVSRIMADAGYVCGLIGKFHLVSAGSRPEPRLDDGFTYWQHSHAPRDDWPLGTHPYADWVRAQGQDLNALRESKDRVPTELHQTKWASDRAIEFINYDHGSPWMLNVNVYDPHPPFIPPASYSRRFNPSIMPGPYFRDSDLDNQARLGDVDFQGGAMSPEEFGGKDIQAKYYAMIAQIDDQFARIMETLEKSGQIDNTVVVLTSDHGEALGDHGLVQKGCRFYEGLSRVPLIFSWPGVIVPNQQYSGLVELLDLSATLLTISKVEIPDYHQGLNLLPILKGEQTGDSIRKSVRCEYFDALDNPSTEGSGSFATMYRTERHKICVYHDQGIGELFDLQEDPWEFNNLWDDPAHGDIRSRLIFESFNSHVVLTTDVGSKRIAPM